MKFLILFVQVLKLNTWEWRMLAMPRSLSCTEIWEGWWQQKTLRTSLHNKIASGDKHDLNKQRKTMQSSRKSTRLKNAASRLLLLMEFVECFMICLHRWMRGTKLELISIKTCSVHILWAILCKLSNCFSDCSSFFFLFNSFVRFNTKSNELETANIIGIET